MPKHIYSDTPNAAGNYACERCGAIRHPEMTATCPDQGGGQAATEPRAKPPSVVYDHDAIADRLTELRAERDAEINRPAHDEEDQPAVTPESDIFDFSGVVTSG